MFGIHGDWGSGKTSFLHQLHWYLSGVCPESQASEDRIEVPGEWVGWKAREDITVVWFEAWQYQCEANPIIALLHEIRKQLEASRPWTAIKDKSKKLGEVVIKSAFFGLESLTKVLCAEKAQQVGEKWEADHYAVKLPSNVVRELLNDAISKLLGNKGDSKSKRRLVVLIDDLDRCEGEAAYRLLEGIKIYLNIESCVFVIGMDQHLIKRAVMDHIPGASANGGEALAEEYIEKICRNIWNLPNIQLPEAFLEKFLDVGDKAKKVLMEVLKSTPCLPPNPRKIKAFAHVLDRFIKHTGFGAGTCSHQALTKLEDEKIAGLIIVMAALYHFHYDLYRMIEGDPIIYNEIRQAASGMMAPLEWMKQILWVDVPKGDTKLQAPVSEYKRERTYAELRRGNAFRVQRLIAHLDVVPDDVIQACLLGREVK